MVLKARNGCSQHAMEIGWKAPEQRVTPYMQAVCDAYLRILLNVMISIEDFHEL
jgi:hypothetical protein